MPDELKMLRVIRRIKDTCPVEVKATFLGAHAVPAEYKNKREKYVDLVINEMIPVVASEELADYIDVFCDRGFFSVEDTERILMAGMKYGLTAKLHANELDYSGGIQTGVKYNAFQLIILNVPVMRKYGIAWIRNDANFASGICIFSWIA